jgi:hypothetical protein
MDCAVTAFSEWTPCISCGDRQTINQVSIESRAARNTVAPVRKTSRIRSTIVVATFGGKHCPPLVETKACSQFLCPIDCTVLAWTKWSECSQRCGGGFKTRMRLVGVQARNGGQACPKLSDSASCNTHGCSLGCKLTPFTGWSACSRSCGTGYMRRSRTLVGQLRRSTCPALVQVAPCRTSACPVDCVVSNFTQWTLCSSSCSGGIRWRMRSIERSVAYGGRICPTQLQVSRCNPQLCAVDCVVSTFGGWNRCTHTCGGGTQLAQRIVLRQGLNGGKACPQLSIHRQCGQIECPVDCVMSAYSEWTPCTRSCGEGRKHRSRKTVRREAHGGVACGARNDSSVCNSSPCPVDCVAVPSSNFGCSVSCGSGHRLLSRRVVQPARFGGAHCTENELLVVQVCNTQLCPQDCVMSKPIRSECTVSCGEGSRKVRRLVLALPKQGGAACPRSAASLNEPCNNGPCAIDCEVLPWSSWSDCPSNSNCGEGARVQVRTREIVRHKASGYTCPKLSESRNCPQTAKCWKVLCEVESFGDWSRCSRACGGGFAERIRPVATNPSGNKACNLIDTKACNSDRCNSDCTVTNFSAWSICSSSCGGGRRSRTRVVLQHTQQSGKSCPATQVTAVCNTATCPIDCQITSFGQWSGCNTLAAGLGANTKSRSCGTWLNTRTRSVQAQPSFGGVPCPATDEIRQCTIAVPCPLDCQVSAWTDWSPCSRSCGGGERSRTRSEILPTTHGGRSCPPLEGARLCALQPCPVDCIHSAVSEWMPCTRTCGKGQQHRSRSIERAAAHGGKACSNEQHLLESRSCNLGACTANPCTVGDWGAWPTCPVSCGRKGTRIRTRKLVHRPLFSSSECPSLIEKGSCDIVACGEDCLTSIWGEWTPCSTSCGAGRTKNRTRTVIMFQREGGKLCPALFERRECSLMACFTESGLRVQTAFPTAFPTANPTLLPSASPTTPADKPDGSTTTSMNNPDGSVTTDVVDADGSVLEYKVDTHGTVVAVAGVGATPVNCKVSLWVRWSNCSSPCGGGMKSRKRSVIRPPAHGGKACPLLIEGSTCNEQQCRSKFR